MIPNLLLIQIRKPSERPNDEVCRIHVAGADLFKPLTRLALGFEGTQLRVSFYDASKLIDEVFFTEDFYFEDEIPMSFLKAFSLPVTSFVFFNSEDIPNLLLNIVTTYFDPKFEVVELKEDIEIHFECSSVDKSEGFKTKVIIPKRELSDYFSGDNPE